MNNASPAPYPSNNNFMYLRVAVGQQGEQLQNFCSTCHSAKAGLNAMGVESGSKMKVFSAMDQSKGAGEFLRDQVVIHNDTQTYVTPLGENQPSELVPNYQNLPEWTYAPDMSRVNKQPPEPVEQ